MKVILEGNPKEIAALVLELQERQSVRQKFTPETSEGLSCSTENVATGASRTDNPRFPCSSTSAIP
ncbi:MAG: hypothetical protein E7439_03480 [Ruminococcaceae bacterium]|nr:hypothetical protein [Oscillospiraceae bacterium]